MADNAHRPQIPSSPVVQKPFGDWQSSQQGPCPSTKRRKRDEADRVRVSRACDRCKRKKARCNGKQPCTLCINSGSICEFTAAYTRGRIPSVIPDETRRSDPRCVQQIVIDSNPVVNAFGAGHRAQASFLEELVSDTQATDLLQQDTVHLGEVIISALNRDESRPPMSRNSPEPPQIDLQGHYVGPSSGVSFLLRIQRKLHEKISFSEHSPIFTFGDVPLPTFDPSFFVLPPKADAEKLVARYFDFAVPTHRFLHRPTVEAWIDEFYESLGVIRQKDSGRERTALLFMVFAQATEYLPDVFGPSGFDASVRYFQAADHQLAAETGEICLTSVQARLCQCFYLLSRSRVNHCWSLFGTTAHLILAIGIHRKRRMEASSGADLIIFECRKRVFWAAYVLDTYLSAALGRPRTFHDDDIDQDLPTCVNDSDLTCQRININHSKGQLIMMGCIAHNKLSMIISRILRDLYAIRHPSLPTRVTLTAKYSEELIEWRNGFSRFLDADSVDASLLIPLFQRQRNVLNLAYYHALILVFRPFVLSNFASLNSQSRRLREVAATPEVKKYEAACLDAAIKVTLVVAELHDTRQIYRAFWFMQYFAFCAMVVLYVYVIQQRDVPKEEYQKYFDAAARCQSQISSMAEKNSLAERYSVVLEELRLEAVKQVQHQSSFQIEDFQFPRPSRSVAPESVMQEPHAGNQDRVNDLDDMFSTSDPVTFEGLSGATPSNLMADLTSWGDFDSLVNAGTGGLDFLLSGDQNLP